MGVECDFEVRRLRVSGAGSRVLGAGLECWVGTVHGCDFEVRRLCFSGEGFKVQGAGCWVGVLDSDGAWVSSAISKSAALGFQV